LIDVIVYHHALGLTPGVSAFADRLTAAGHRVMVPDLYDGEMFESVEAGVQHAESVGFDTIIDRGVAAATATDDRFACVGFSLGVLPAQNLAQTHRRAAGAVLCHAAIPLGTFSPDWPAGVALQLHSAARDPLGDFEDAVELASRVPGAELFTYDTAAHLVADSSFADHDPEIAEQIVERTLSFLAAVR
jgi:dienelactone hydrolase